MKTIPMLLVVLMLAGCGADTMSAAATAAAVKKQEIEQGKKTMGLAKQKIRNAANQMQRSADRTAAAADDN